jgi:L-threonylcarbamoyladenylate synthase
VQTQVLKADSRENIKLAADLIRRGETVAFPTETVYGLGADATNKAAVAKIFTAKERPTFDPLIVHIAGKEMLTTVVKVIHKVTWRLIDTFWPGPLTLILPKRDEIPDIVTAGLPTVAVRMPRHEVALALIEEAGVPIAAPSANSFGRPSPTRAEHVMEDLGGKIALILDGGPTQVGIESTVLDLTSSPLAILRPGGVSKESLERILGEISISSGSEGEVFKSPGQMKQHYAPRAKVLLFNGKCRQRVITAIKEKIDELKNDNRIGVMVPDEEISYFSGGDVVTTGLGSFVNMEAVAGNLFATMRTLDRKGVDYILTLAPPREGIGLAVFDRLFKASGSQVTEVD